MKKSITILIISVILFSCKTLKVSTKEYQIFEILNKITYQHQEITDNDIDYHTIADFLNENEISKLQNWKSPEPILGDFTEADCIGCSNDIKKFTPIYKVTKGDYIQFEIKKSDGIENLVFTKKGTFINHFFTFQGYSSKSKITQELKKRGDRGYIIEGIYPSQVNTNDIYLKHIDYSNQNDNGDWYNTVSPINMDYFINFKEKKAPLRFKFNDGFYSYQKNDENGNQRMIHFFKPQFLANATDFNELQSYTSNTFGYYGEATFFLISLEEKMLLSVEINSNVKDRNFEFSIFKNNNFHSINEFMAKKNKTHTKYVGNLKQGDYLIRVISGKPTYWDSSLYELNVLKTKLK